MTTEYELTLYDPRGTAITKQLTAFSSLEYTRKINEVGSLVLKLPSQFPLWWFGRDYRIEVWRSIDGRPAYLDGDTQWLIRKINISREGGDRVLNVTAYDLNHLLKRRIVAYDAKSVYADKSDYADDMMKEIFSENFGIGCIDALRDWSEWISIQPDFGLAMPIEKEFARRTVFNIFQEMAEYSYQNGIYLAFDIVRLTSSMVEFRTYVNQRGVDHSKGSLSPLLFGAKYGNLTNDDYLDDSSEEATFIYAGGKGEDAARVVEDAQDDARIGVSPFGRIEYFIDARETDVAADVKDEAEAELRKRVPKRIISGKVADIDGCRYGLHYKMGDKVTVETDEVSMDAYIDSAHVTVSGSTETIDVGLEATW
jgi:hypothetical protein